MISLHSTGSPTQTSDAYTLLAILADPEAAKKRLDDLVAEKQAAQQAAEEARATAKQAAEDRAVADRLAAETKRRGEAFDSEHAAKTSALEGRHQALLATDARLRDYEAKVAAREKALGEPLVARERAVETREAELNERADELDGVAAKLAQAKEELDLRAKKILEAVK